MKFINHFKKIKPKEVLIYKFYVRLYAKYFNFKFENIIVFILKTWLRKFLKIRNNLITFKINPKKSFNIKKRSKNNFNNKKNIF